MTFDEEYKKIYSDYLEVIVPLVSFYESISSSFPIGILNEIRAIFTHIAKSVILESDEDKKRQIEKISGHMMRSIRDCYKYNCMAIEEKYKIFMSLSNVLDKVREKAFDLHEKAIDALYIARRMENGAASDAKAEEIHGQYKDAYNIFLTINALIKDNSTEFKS